MILAEQRQRIVAALVLASLAITSIVVAQPRFRFNGRDDAELSRRSERRNGQVMAPAREFFGQFGTNVERRGDWYSARREGHEYRFRPGSRTWYRDNTPYYFRQAPYERDGRLFLSILDLIGALGGRYDWDNRYDRGDIWWGQTPTGYGSPYGPGYGYYPQPDQLSVQFPRSFARVSDRGVNVGGVATPYGDLRILVYRDQGRTDRLVFDTRARSDRNGQWAMWVPLFGNGTYKIITQLLSDYGGVIREHRTTVYAD